MKKFIARTFLASSLILLVGYGSCEEDSTSSNTKSTGKEMVFDKPVFTKSLGRLSMKDPGNRTKECVLKGDHNSIASKLGEISKLLATAKTKPLHEAFHFKPEVPSIEIYGYLYNTDSSGNIVKEDVLLFQDYETVKTRSGDEAGQLINLVNKVCSGQ